MTRQFDNQPRDDSRPPSHRIPSSRYAEQQSARPARPRLNRAMVDRGWENGSPRHHADYHPRVSNGQAPQNNWRKNQEAGDSSYNGPAGNRTNGNHRAQRIAPSFQTPSVSRKRPFKSKGYNAKIDASAISIRRVNHTVPITKGNHKDVALTTIASDVPTSIAIMAPNPVGNMLMAMVTIDRNAIQSGTKAKNIEVSTEEIRNKDNYIHASRVDLRYMQGEQKRLKVFSRSLEGLGLRYMQVEQKRLKVFSRSLEGLGLRHMQVEQKRLKVFSRSLEGLGLRHMQVEQKRLKGVQPQSRGPRPETYAGRTEKAEGVQPQSRGPQPEKYAGRTEKAEGVQPQSRGPQPETYAGKTEKAEGVQPQSRGPRPSQRGYKWPKP